MAVLRGDVNSASLEGCSPYPSRTPTSELQWAREGPSSAPQREERRQRDHLLLVGTARAVQMVDRPTLVRAVRELPMLVRRMLVKADPPRIRVAQAVPYGV